MQLKNLFTAAAIVWTLSACSSVRLDAGAPVTDAGSQSAIPADTHAVASVDLTASQVGKYRYAELNATTGVLSQRSVYFDFDSYLVKPSYAQMLTAHASFLRSHPDQQLAIQGNTDDVGGSEYNLALGQKRAEAVKKTLTMLGVPEKQLEATSFGKEKPKALDTDEASRAENRRGDLDYAY